MERGTIEINGLRVQSRLGITDAERSIPQEISLDIRMIPKRKMLGLDDCIENTIDYFEVSECVKELSSSGERKLIETLAEEVIDCLFVKYPLHEVRVTVRKYVMSNTNFVSVSLLRTS